VFGEVCLEKEPRSTVNVVSHTTVKVYLLNKWDVMRTLPKDVWSQLQESTLVKDLDESLLREQFFRCEGLLVAQLDLTLLV